MDKEGGDYFISGDNLRVGGLVLNRGGTGIYPFKRVCCVEVWR